MLKLNPIEEALWTLAVALVCLPVGVYLYYSNRSVEVDGPCARDQFNTTALTANGQAVVCLDTSQQWKPAALPAQEQGGATAK
jgi:hypothetical protein